MKYLLYTLSAVSILASCKKKTDDATEFDKAALLENVASTIIVPELNDFSTELNTLQTSFATFENDMNQANLDVVRENWKAAYASWQSVKIYDFGPVLTNGLKAATGIFPSDTTQIQNNISSGTYTLASASNTDAIGLSALDYLLYQTGALDKFINTPNYAMYASDLIDKMVNEVNIVKANWNSYKSTFVASTGTETTSAFSLLVNEFNKDYEIAKNAKLGIPIGKQSLGIQLPDYIEARYSGYSLDLLRSSIVSHQGLYNGDRNASSGSGVGFYEYLVHLERKDLADAINTRFNQIITKIDGFQGTLEGEMATNATELDNLYTLLHGQVINLKTDMTSAFGVLITYQDNDGD